MEKVQKPSNSVYTGVVGVVPVVPQFLFDWSYTPVIKQYDIPVLIFAAIILSLIQEYPVTPDFISFLRMKPRTAVTQFSVLTSKYTDIYSSVSSVALVFLISHTTNISVILSSKLI
jgi:hypothetical protein